MKLPDLILALTALALAGSSAVRGQGCSEPFSTPRTIDLLTSPGDALVIEADLDGDGDLDVVVGSAGQTGLYWLANDGTGGFGTQRLISSPAALSALVATDVDGDGDNDILYASQVDGVVWYNNFDGAGAFSFGATITSAGMDAIVAQDVDSDGVVDVVAASLDDDEISWFRNQDGQGSFGPANEIDSIGMDGISLQMADFDGDLDNDLLVALTAAPTPQFLWYANRDGVGTFGEAQLIAEGDPLRPSTVLAVDLDGDDAPDVLAGGGGLNWYRNLGGGEFGPSRSIFQATPDSISTGDVDGDGDVDVLAGFAGSNRIAWGENTNGAGVFGPRRTITTGARSFAGVRGPDLDGDGAADILAWWGEVGVIVWRKSCSGDEAACARDPLDCNGNGTPDECDLVDNDCNFNGVPDECDECDGTPFPAGCDLRGTDCNGNGVPDHCELEGNDCNNNGVLDRCDARRRFSGVMPIDVDGALVDSYALADINGDGAVDVVVVTWEDLVWFENDGAGRFTRRPIDYFFDFSLRVLAADIDGDLDIDLVLYPSGGDYFQVIENLDGAGFFGVPRFNSIGSVSLQAMRVADIDNDGDGDVLWTSNRDRSFAWQENLNGLPTFGAPQLIGEGYQARAEAADLNGDGALDVAVVGDDRVVWFANDGGGSFGAEQVINANLRGASRLLLSDLDEDGDVDLFASSAERLVYHENLAGQGFSAGQLLFHAFSVAPFLTITRTDVDRDGDADVVVAQTGLFWFSNLDGAGTLGAAQLLDVVVSGFGGLNVQFADLDLDGDSDLVIHDSVGMAWLRNVGGDCNANRIPDECDLDANGNGVPDDCCPADVDGDNDVDMNDLAIMIAAFGTQDEAVPSDLDGDGDVDLADLTILLLNFGTNC